MGTAQRRRRRRRKWSRSIHSSSKRHDWRTPRELLDDIERAFRGPIDLDPCPALDARHHFARVNLRDGLAVPWRSRRIFVNSPYGEALRKQWIPRVIEHVHARRQLAVLAPARTDTAWFRSLVDRAHAHVFERKGGAAFCLLHGRLRFELPDGSAGDAAPFPCLVFYFGSEAGARRFARVFHPRGIIVTWKRTPHPSEYGRWLPRALTCAGAGSSGAASDRSARRRARTRHR